MHSDIFLFYVDRYAFIACTKMFSWEYFLNVHETKTVKQALFTINSTC